MNQQHVAYKAVATVRDVARMVGLSPARFYQLQREGVFPLPVYDLVTRRPLYTTEQQEACVEVRKRHLGINGRPVAFYARRVVPHQSSPTRRSRTAGATAKRADAHAETVASLRDMGLTGVTSEQVAAAIKAEYPQGTDGDDNSTVLGRLFLRLHRQDSSDKHGR